jgi:hypothetical protein
MKVKYKLIHKDKDSNARMIQMASASERALENTPTRPTLMYLSSR